MRPLRYSINVTLDGCVDHRAGSTDEELHRFWAEKLAQADALLFGRVTYEMMQAAWRWPANGLRPEWMADALGGTPAEFARKRDVLHAHCQDIGRDPKEIMLSSHVRLNPDGDLGPVVETAAALGEQGLDLVVGLVDCARASRLLLALAAELGDSHSLALAQFYGFIPRGGRSR